MLVAGALLGSTSRLRADEPSEPVGASDPTVASTPSPSRDEATPDASSTTSGSPSAATTAPAALWRAALVLVGDPNDEARAAAAHVAAALEESVRFPSDPAIVASLLGESGEETIDAMLRARRSLGGSEREDVQTLASLGDRADVAVLVLVRARAGAREIVVFDVRHRAFFEGVLAADASAERLARFVRSRARAATRELASVPDASSDSSAVARSITPRSDPAEAPTPDWIELNWPYLVAGGLLAGAAAFVIVYTTSQHDPMPMLRFRPGGSP